VVAGQGGSEVGYAAYADAAAFNPRTKAWRRLPSLPERRMNATVTWTGTEVLVVGGRSGPGKDQLYRDGVAYNPRADSWRRLPTMTAGRIGHSAEWTGEALLVWGGSTVRSSAWTTPTHGESYDPRTDRWTALPVAPLRGRTEHAAVWTGDEMLVWGGVSVGDPGSVRVFLDGATYSSRAARPPRPS
jgi:N-acetylneuraminic acid mutarotase